jgi:FKBP-type peptidyl-prolyl cis-trans isomerase
MSTSKGQRVAAFSLAALFLLSTIGATAYVIWEINRGSGGLVNDAQLNQSTTQQPAQNEQPDPPTGLAGFEPPVTIGELRYEDQTIGTGDTVLQGDQITFNYTGVLATTGEVFDSSNGTPVTYGLGQLIAGWQQGIPGMKEGGKRRLFIPAELGYGSQGSGSIPANSDLVFDIEIVQTDRGQ